MYSSLKRRLPNPDNAVSEKPGVSGGLEVVIPFTSLASVQRSIRHAERLCSDLPASLSVVRSVEVPFPLELESPQVPLPALVAELSELQSALPLCVDIRLCRDWKQGLLSALPDSSVVVLTYERRILRTEEERVAQVLRKAGHQVSLFLEERFHV